MIHHLGWFKFGESLTLPLLVALFGGTALGGWLSTHTNLLIGLSTSYFIAALVVSFWLLNRRNTHADSCEPGTVAREESGTMEGQMQ
jgi:hypothetical protein